MRFARIEKESQLRLFKTLLEKLAIGVLVFDTESKTIAIMNNSASKLLNMPNTKYWNRLKKREPNFACIVESLEFGGRKLATLEEQGMKKELSASSFRFTQQNNAAVALAYPYQKTLCKCIKAL